MELTKHGKEYCLFLRNVDVDREEEVVFSDKFVELKVLKTKKVYYYKIRSKVSCKEYYTGYSILFYFPSKCQKEEISYTDTANLISLTKNKYNKGTAYVFGQAENEIVAV